MKGYANLFRETCYPNKGRLLLNMGDGGGGHTTTLIVVLVVIGGLALLSAPIMQGILGIMKDMTDVTKDIADSLKELVDLVTGIINNIVTSCSSFSGACRYFEIFGAGVASLKFLAVSFRFYCDVAAFFGSERAKRIKRFFADPTKTRLYQVAEIDATLRGVEVDEEFNPLSGDCTSRLKDIKSTFDAATFKDGTKEKARQAVIDAAMAKFVSDSANDVAKRQGGTEEQRKAAQSLADQMLTDFKATAETLKQKAAELGDEELDQFIEKNNLGPPDRE